jgi:primosomal protein N' (replication factor Y)
MDQSAGLSLSTTPSQSTTVEVVFDRPLDQTFTYVVPEELVDAVAVGKRVEVPFGKADKLTTGYCVRLDRGQPAREAKSILRVLDDEPLVIDPILRLTRWMADYYLCAWGQVLHAVVPASVRDQVGLREAIMLEAVPEEELPLPRPELTERQQRALQLLRQLGRRIEQRELMRLARCGPGPVYELVRRGYARPYVERVEKFTPTEDHESPACVQTLSPDQERALSAIREGLQAQRYQAFLLHGVTGSGKTEVYLRAIEEVVRQGREVIVLVPEISLTPQTLERFRGRCGSVAVLHSHLNEAERGAYWRRVAAGLVQVVVGARSAIFAPTRKLGLIVIDEEHEHSFKQESVPRYHARDVAVMRAKLENIPIILGSATPSSESWYAAQHGDYTLLSLPNRVMDRPLPQIELVDLRSEPVPRGERYGAISPSLRARMEEALEAGGQVMLLLNRRGYSTHVHCTTCGYIVSCPNCDLAMTYHRWRKAFVCHHCAYEERPAERCPECAKKKRRSSLQYRGLGTEKLQAELTEKFPGKVIQRMDSDTMAQPGSHARVLEAFRHGLIHILLGTQMIAKGLDFPNVTLVGVINADTGLHLPDFRAAERTFQLLAQVAGRAGRGPRGGRVVVQTFTPEHPSIALAATHDYARFIEQELAFRQQHGYPPFERMARLIVRSLDEDAARAFAAEVAGILREAIRSVCTQQPGSVRVLGPAEASVYRLNNYYRFHLQVQSAVPVLLHRVLRLGVARMRPPRAVEYQLDVDPHNML